MAESIKHPDAILVAMQLGRLDLVSTLLAVLGILIGLGTLIGYWEFRAKVIKRAENAAADAAGKYIEIRLADMVAEAVRFQLSMSVGSVQGNDIATNIDDKAPDVKVDENGGK